MLSFILFSCRDKEPDDPRPAPQTPPVKEEQLPPVTTTGAGTFGCKVNGKVWVAKNKGSFPYVYSSVNRADSWFVNVSGNLIINPIQFETINLTFFHLNKSNYDLKLRKDENPGGTYIDVNANKFWHTDSITGGEIQISRFDTINQIISGTFYFDCVNKETHDTLHITEGRFDMGFVY